MFETSEGDMLQLRHVDDICWRVDIRSYKCLVVDLRPGPKQFSGGAASICSQSCVGYENEEPHTQSLRSNGFFIEFIEKGNGMHGFLEEFLQRMLPLQISLHEHRQMYLQLHNDSVLEERDAYISSVNAFGPLGRLS